jgi:hypothetical protein
LANFVAKPLKWLWSDPAGCCRYYSIPEKGTRARARSTSLVLRQSQGKASRIRIRNLLSSCKNSKKNLDSYYFVTLFDFVSLKNYVNVASKSNKQKKLC